MEHWRGDTLVTGPGVRVTRSGHCGGELGQCQVPPNVVVILDTDKSNTRTEKLDIKAPGGTQHSALTGECIPPPPLNFHSARQINYQKFNGPAKRYLMVINYILFLSSPHTLGGFSPFYYLHNKISNRRRFLTFTCLTRYSDTVLPSIRIQCSLTDSPTLSAALLCSRLTRGRRLVGGWRLERPAPSPWLWT